MSVAVTAPMTKAALARHRANGGSKEYKTWVWMRSRISRGEGIYATLAAAPRYNSFENFFEDVGLWPGPGYTLDREDNELGYTRNNLGWVDDAEQRNNRSNTFFIELDGEKVPVAVAARRVGICNDVLRLRFIRGDRDAYLIRPVKAMASFKRMRLLTNEQAVEIFTRFDAGEAGVRLAAEFGVSRSLIIDIVHKRGYADATRGLVATRKSNTMPKDYSEHRRPAKTTKAQDNN